MSRALEAAGIEVLINENRRLPAPFQDLWVCGLDDYLTGEVDVQQPRLSGADGTRIVLMHAPDNLLRPRGVSASTWRSADIRTADRSPCPEWSVPRVAPGPLSRVYSRGRYRLATAA